MCIWGLGVGTKLSLGQGQTQPLTCHIRCYLQADNVKIVLNYRTHRWCQTVACWWKKTPHLRIGIGIILGYDRTLVQRWDWQKHILYPTKAFMRPRCLLHWLQSPSRVSLREWSADHNGSEMIRATALPSSGFLAWFNVPSVGILAELCEMLLRLWKNSISCLEAKV